MRRLDRGRIYILPTATGWLYALLLSVMLMTAINYNLALGHAFVFLLASVGFMGILHTFRNLHGLHFKPGEAAAVFVGEAATFPMLFENRSPKPRPNLQLSKRQGAALDFNLKPEQPLWLEIPIPTHERGWHRLPPLRLSTRYPLGLFEAWAKLTPHCKCLVYPAPETPWPPFPPLTGIQSPNNSKQQAGTGGDDFAGLRPHQTGESLHHVDWKAHARRAPDACLLIKQFADDRQADLILDWQMTEPLVDTEKRLARLCAWILQAEAQGLRYNLRLPNREFASDNSPVHRVRCLEALAFFPDVSPR